MKRYQLASNLSSDDFCPFFTSHERPLLADLPPVASVSFGSVSGGGIDTQQT
ncbi:hypothetical protein [Pseudomonas antarctica]|uniref:hypothetical protein n=1 Tax=Pseudomonas antarctica TaxID=219572 RepID=UPI00387B991C